MEDKPPHVIPQTRRQTPHNVPSPRLGLPSGAPHQHSCLAAAVAPPCAASRLLHKHKLFNPTTIIFPTRNRRRYLAPMENSRNARSRKSLSGPERLRPVASARNQSVNNPAVGQGSPPCGVNKTQGLEKGMAEAGNSSRPLMNVQQCSRAVLPPHFNTGCGPKHLFWPGGGG